MRVRTAIHLAEEEVAEAKRTATELYGTDDVSFAIGYLKAALTIAYIKYGIDKHQLPIQIA